MTKSNHQPCDIGLIGLGVMGRNLLLNMADKGFRVAGFDKNAKPVQALRESAEDRPVVATDTLEEFLQVLRPPRAIMLLVPAGDPVAAVLQQLQPHLKKDDVVIDGGNSYFKDTEERQRMLFKHGVHFLGVGISGGEEGARRGPSMMPGGDPAAYERVRPIFEASAANANNEPCVTYLGPRGAGHFVKMVHNGIEYGIMQLIAETYDLLTRGLGFETPQLEAVYDCWNQSQLNGFLVEISARICAREDERSARPLVEMIRDVAQQKGTGMWTSQSAMELQVPAPTINTAVTMRHLSAFKEDRRKASASLNGPSPQIQGDHEAIVNQLENACLAAVILTYAQGFALLHAASREYRYKLQLKDVARIWRGGCIIRAALLDDIAAAYERDATLPNLLLDEALGQKVAAAQTDLRRVIELGTKAGLPLPAFMMSLAYFDSYRSVWLPANMIQAQRDFFGSHTYERVDTTGACHTDWRKEVAHAVS